MEHESEMSEFQQGYQNYQQPSNALDINGPINDQICALKYKQQDNFNRSTLPNSQKEYLPNIETFQSKDKNILLCHLIEYLKRCGFPLQGAMIFTLDINVNMFLYCGNDPISHDYLVNCASKSITLKYRQHAQNMHQQPAAVAQIMKQEFNYDQTQSDPQLILDKSHQQMPIKRIKERQISEVLEKVTQWRKLYQGCTNEQGEHIKMQLDVAAQRVGVSKKTLDDYLSQIRYGQKFGFNFNAHLHDKIGVLRAFVREHKQNEKQFPDNSSTKSSNKTNFKNMLPLPALNTTSISHSRQLSPIELNHNLQIQSGQLILTPPNKGIVGFQDPSYFLNFSNSQFNNNSLIESENPCIGLVDTGYSSRKHIQKDYFMQDHHGNYNYTNQQETF